MIFNLHDFVMKTLKGMSAKYDEFQVREYALKWYSKGVLTDEDLSEVEGWYYTEEPTENDVEGWYTPDETTEQTEGGV